MNLGGTCLSGCRFSKAWFALGLFLFFLVPTASFGQGSKLTSQFEAADERDQDHPKQRDAWFMRGRTVPGRSPALLRYRAHQQKLQMRAQRAAPLAARAQTRVPAAGSSSVWTPLGPAPLASDASGGGGVQDYNWVSGRATAVAVDPADSTGNTVFVGGAFGGVWKSSNAGPLSNSPSQVTWTPVIDDLGSLAVGAIAIQPGNSNPANSLVLVGTGEPNSSADSYYGLGIFRSTDAGSTWSLIQSANSGSRSFAGLGFSKIAFSTSNRNLVVAAAAAATQGIVEGLEVPNTVNRGLYYSTDAGVTWTYASVKDSGATIAPGSATAVVYNPTAGAFFAAMRYHGMEQKAGSLPPGPNPAAGGPHLANPLANPVQRLMAMPPEQRERVLEKLPPQQQANLRQRLDEFDKLPPQERARRLQLLQSFSSLPPEKQQVLARQLPAFNALPEDRRKLLRGELVQLWRMPEADRQARLNSDALKSQYSPSELQMLSDISQNYPNPAR